MPAWSSGTIRRPERVFLCCSVCERWKKFCVQDFCGFIGRVHTLTNATKMYCYNYYLILRGIYSLRSWRDFARESFCVLVAKPWTRVAKPWEDWWRVQLNSRLPKFVGFFELCVHQWTRISDWLRVPKRQSSVNLYLSSFPGEKVCFHTQICNGQCEEMQRGSFEFPEYPLEEQKNYANGRTGKGR